MGRKRYPAEHSKLSWTLSDPALWLSAIVAVVCAAGVAVANPASVDVDLQDLSGTAWRLLKIASMDDTITRPEDDDEYRLVFAIDGSIIEFAPLAAAEATATVGALSVVTDDPDALRGIILSRLLDGYASAAGVVVTDREVESYLSRVDRRLREDPGEAYDDGASLAADERAEIERVRRRMAVALIRQWKINKALHEEYGGRIIYQQLGPEPLDAYRAVLQEAHEAGEFSIRSTEMEASLWAFFEDDRRRTLMRPGDEDEARAFDTPPWEMSERARAPYNQKERRGTCARHRQAFSPLFS